MSCSFLSIRNSACLIIICLLTVSIPLAVAEKRILSDFSVYDINTANDVDGLQNLKRMQTVQWQVLPERVGVRVAIEPRGALKLVLRINGKRVRRLRGRRNIAEAMDGLELSSEWIAKKGMNTFTALSVYRDRSRSYRGRFIRRVEKKVRKIKLVDSPKPKPTATPQPSPSATPRPTATSTPQPTATATPQPTASATPQPTATSTPQPTASATPQPTATATPQPTATPNPNLEACGAGVNKVLGLPTSSVTFSGYCSISNISSIVWHQTSGPKSVTFSNVGALTPLVSGFTTAGVYKFRVTIQHSQGTTVDTMQVGVSKQVGSSNFTAAVTGPNNVVRGFPIYLDLITEKSSGGHDYVYVAVAGLPHGVDYTMSGWAENCCDGGARGWDHGQTLMHFTVDSGVTPGAYPITVQVSSGGIIRTASHTLNVLDVPGDLAQTSVSSVPAIPRLAQWEHNMTHFGSLWCDASQISLWEGSVWYYDGMRIYYQIADYTGNVFWANTCVPIVRNVYRPFVLGANGAVQGWRVFPHGLQMDYERKGETQSRNAAQLMAQNSSYANSGGAVSIDEIRETAYLINVYSIAEELGAEEHEKLQQALAFALGHLDQVAVSKSNPKVKPFMIALTFEALIRYYEKTGDPRIPSVLKQAADFLWQESGAWDEATQSFLYINQHFSGEDDPDPAPDLNLLIAPLFAWLYHKTGESKYQQWGDKVFAGGITEDFDNDGYYDGGACLGCTGKIFSQNYRWSIDYVNWRQNPPH